MIPLGHVGGVPVEELLPWLAGPGTVVMARVWLAAHLRRQEDRVR